MKTENGRRNTYPCPHSITTNNKYMGGVDRNDQMREYYHVRLKYYKYLFWMSFDVSITNAFVLAKTNPVMHNETKSMKAFRTALAQQLLEWYCSRKRKGRKPTQNSTKNTRKIITHSEVTVSSIVATIVPYKGREERQYGIAMTAIYIYAIKA